MAWCVPLGRGRGRHRRGLANSSVCIDGGNQLSSVPLTATAGEEGIRTASLEGTTTKMTMMTTMVHNDCKAAPSSSLPPSSAIVVGSERKEEATLSNWLSVLFLFYSPAAALVVPHALLVEARI